MHMSLHKARSNVIQHAEDGISTAHLVSFAAAFGAWALMVVLRTIPPVDGLVAEQSMLTRRFGSAAASSQKLNARTSSHQIRHLPAISRPFQTM